MLVRIGFTNYMRIFIFISYCSCVLYLCLAERGQIEAGGLENIVCSIRCQLVSKIFERKFSCMLVLSCVNIL